MLPDHYEKANRNNYDRYLIDLCITDLPSWSQHSEELMAIRNRQSPVHVPIMLLGSPNSFSQIGEDTLKRVDQLLWTPLKKRLFRARLENLHYARTQSLELNLYRQAMDQANSGIVITDNERPDNPIIYTNKTFSDITGYSREETEGQNCRFLQGQDRQQEARFQLQDAVKQGQSISVQLRNYTKNGKMFWNRLNVAPIRNMQDQITNFVGVQDDVTDYVSLKEDLEYELDFEKALIESLPGIFTFIDEHLNYIKWNKNFERNLGYTPEEIKNMEPADFIAEEHRESVNRTIENIFNQGEDSVQARLQTKQGQTIPHFLTGKRFERDGRTYFLGYALDISEQVHYREQLQYRLDEKTMLLSEIHHRVKNNLAVISGLLDMQKEQSDSQKVQNQLSDAFGRIQSIAIVHEQLYQQAESDAYINLQTYLPKLVDTIQEVSSTDEKQITTSVDAEKTKIPLDQAVSVGLMINELLTNSFKHAFRKKSEGHVKVTTETQDDKLQINISDDGIGLPEDFSIQEPSGMGLQIVNTLLQQLSADLTHDSTSGEGAVFSIQIPLERDD